MELAIIPSAAKNISGVTVSYLDNVIEFKGTGSLYCGKNDVNLFNSLNEYLANIPLEDEQALFECYREAKTILDPSENEDGILPDNEILSNQGNYRFLIKKLSPIIERILNIIKVKNLEYFVTQNGYAEPPKDLEDNYSRGEFPKETTIDRYSYQDIARFVFILRPIMPIIIEMMAAAEKITGKDYKEAVTGLLIKDNSILMQHPGWKKIYEYFQYSYNAPKKSINPLRLEIITEEAYGDHAIYKALFNRLCLSHVPSLVPEKNLAKNLFSIAMQFDATKNQVKERKPTNDENSKKQSIHEVCQLKESVNSAEEMAEAEYFSFGLLDEYDNPKHKDRFVYQCQGLGIKDPKLVEKLYDLIPDTWDFELCIHMIKLFQLAFAEEVSYNIIYALEHPQLPAGLALAQAKLHEMGYRHLAVLLTAIPDETLMRTHTTDMFSLTSEERKDIESLCDVVKASKVETSSDNEAVNATVDFFKRLTLSGWKSTIDPDMIDMPGALDSAIKGNLYEVELTKDYKTEFLALIQQVNQ